MIVIINAKHRVSTFDFWNKDMNQIEKTLEKVTHACSRTSLTTSNYAQLNALTEEALMMEE